MKKFVLFVATLSVGFMSFSQSKQGTINYEIHAIQVDTIQVDAQPNMNDSKLDIYFTEKQSRIDFQMNEMMKISVVLDRSTNQGIRLLDGAMGQFYVAGEADEMGMTHENKSEDRVTLIDETKEILGFTCKKALVSSKGVETEYWYTEELEFDFSGQEILNSNIPGFPLAFTTLSNGMRMDFIAVNYSAEVENAEATFSTDVPEGFQEIPQQFRQQVD